MLNIKNIHAKINDTQILNGLSLKVAAGEVHARAVVESVQDA